MRAKFQVFYVGQDQRLKRSYLPPGGVTWLADHTLSNHTAKAGTRHLSISSIRKANTIYDLTGNDTFVAALLFFENWKGSITALINVARPLSVGPHYPDGSVRDLVPTVDEWMDVSSHTATPAKPLIPLVYNPSGNTTLYESFSLSQLYEGPRFETGEFIPVNGDNLTVAGSMFGTPFTCGPLLSKGIDDLSINAFFYAGEGDPDTIYGGKYSHGQKASFLTAAVYQSDNISNLHHGIFHSGESRQNRDHQPTVLRCL